MRAVETPEYSPRSVSGRIRLEASASVRALALFVSRAPLLEYSTPQEFWDQCGRLASGHDAVETPPRHLLPAPDKPRCRGEERQSVADLQPGEEAGSIAARPGRNRRASPASWWKEEVRHHPVAQFPCT